MVEDQDKTTESTETQKTKAAKEAKAAIEAKALPVPVEEQTLPTVVNLSLDIEKIRVRKESSYSRRCSLALMLCFIFSMGISFQAILIWISLGLVASGILEQRFRGSAILAGPEQFPDVFEATVRACTKLGVDAEVETYVTKSPGGLDVYTLKLRRKYAIVLNADWVSMFNIHELEFIIAREVAHIRAGHLSRLSLINVLRSAPPVLRLLAAPLEIYRYIYSPWTRYAAMTADRLALESTKLDLNHAVSALAKIAAGEELAYAVNPKAFVAQAEALPFDLYVLINELVAGGPLPVRRVKMLEDYLGKRPKEGYPAPPPSLLRRFIRFLMNPGASS